MDVNKICMNCMAGEINENGVCAKCGASEYSIKTSSRYLPLRTILRGKYLIGKVIGEGGFGITYLAYDLNLEIRVAVKEFCPRDYAGRDAADGLTIRPYDAKSSEFYLSEKDKFINEAKRLAKFRSQPGVVSVMDYFAENGTVYLAMDYIDGMTLKKFRVLAQGAPMPVDTVLRMMKPVIETLDKIHSEGIIHRDISPDNIMITKDYSDIYLIDFGTARNASVDGEHSVSVYKKGTYTPVEQQSTHGKQGAWTDVYALCATIYVCITGRTLPEAVDRMIDDTMVLPSRLGIAVSPQVEQALVRGLAVKPEERIQSMRELWKALYEGNEAAMGREPAPQNAAPVANQGSTAPVSDRHDSAQDIEEKIKSRGVQYQKEKMFEGWKAYKKSLKMPLYIKAILMWLLSCIMMFYSLYLVSFDVVSFDVCDFISGLTAGDINIIHSNCRFFIRCIIWHGDWGHEGYYICVRTLLILTLLDFFVCWLVNKRISSFLDKRKSISIKNIIFPCCADEEKILAQIDFMRTIDIWAGKKGRAIKYYNSRKILRDEFIHICRNDANMSYVVFFRKKGLNIITFTNTEISDYFYGTIMKADVSDEIKAAWRQVAEDKLVLIEK